MTTNKIDPVKFLIECIDRGIVNEVFSDKAFDPNLNAYVFPSLYFAIPKQLFDDVIRDTARYRGYDHSLNNSIPHLGTKHVT